MSINFIEKFTLISSAFSCPLSHILCHTHNHFCSQSIYISCHSVNNKRLKSNKNFLSCTQSVSLLVEFYGSFMKQKIEFISMHNQQYDDDDPVCILFFCAGTHNIYVQGKKIINLIARALEERQFEVKKKWTYPFSIKLYFSDILVWKGKELLHSENVLTSICL